MVRYPEIQTNSGHKALTHAQILSKFSGYVYPKRMYSRLGFVGCLETTVAMATLSRFFGLELLIVPQPKPMH